MSSRRGLKRKEGESSSSPILIGLHDRLIHNLLQLLILPNDQERAVSFEVEHLEGRESSKAHLQVGSDHHLQHQEQLSIRDEPVSIHVVHLEGNC